MQHDCIGSSDAQLAKVIGQLLYRVHSKVPRLPILTVRSSLIPNNGNPEATDSPFPKPFPEYPAQRLIFSVRFLRALSLRLRLVFGI